MTPRRNPVRTLERVRALRAWVAVCCAFAWGSALAVETVEQALARADSMRTANPAEFARILDSIAPQAQTLAPASQEHLRYLLGWRSAYRGEYTAALRLLKSVREGGGDVTLRFRAGITEVNVYVLASRYEEAFSQLGQLLELSPNVSQKDALEQGYAVAAYLYNQVGEYDLALSYTDKILARAPTTRGACNGRQLMLEALYKSGKITASDPQLQAGLDACIAGGETTYANMIRTYIARLHINQDRFEDAIRILLDHYEETQRSRYPRLISEYDALLATAYRETGNAELVRQYAMRAIETGVQDHYTEPTVIAYRLLYVIAKEKGDVREALKQHEQYVAANKVYLDDTTAKQLAFQRVSHEALADKLRIDTLNKENEVLQLQRELDKKAVEARGLYILMLILVAATIALWAYRTKRSQLHFMRLSQVDGLTGIANRPRFIELAEAALAVGAHARQESCVVLCDLDHFKSINDQYGHAAGDFVLKQVVAACQMHLRAADIFGRFGGEEFGIVLPGCNLDDARQRAEQLRLAIAAVSGNYDGAELQVSASFGVSSSAAVGYELRQLLASADAALYRAKHDGRNCVAVYEPARQTGAPTDPRYGFGGGAADAMARTLSSRF